MSGKPPGTWIRFWQSFQWLSRSPSLSTAQSIAEPHPVASPLVIEADNPSSEAANLADVAARAIVACPFAPPPPVKADPPAEALEPVEVALPMQSLHPKTDFMLPARLAIVAKLNVASVRAPRHLANRLLPGKAVPLASSVQPVRVRHSQRLEAMKR